MSFRHRVGAAAAISAVLFAGQGLHAQSPVGPPSGGISASCIERVPEGVDRPELSEEFPKKGTIGYEIRLEVTVEHGLGEQVMPEGVVVERGSDAERALSRAHFAIPEHDATAPPLVERKEDGDAATTRVSIPLVMLPPGSGRHELTLPPLPIAVTRASGEQMILCTQPHAVTALDPVGNENDPQIRPNPEPRPQREDWQIARWVAIGLVVGAVLGLLLALWIRQLLRRPAKAKAVPYRLPWEVALEELAELRQSPLLEEAKTDEFYDRVSDCLRKYLGARYRFDGLESTTDEIRRYLKRVTPPIVVLSEIDGLLAECDLVKFARSLPTQDDCMKLLSQTESIVRATTPPIPARTAEQRGARAA